MRVSFSTGITILGIHLTFFDVSGIDFKPIHPWEHRNRVKVHLSPYEDCFISFVPSFPHHAGLELGHPRLHRRASQCWSSTPRLDQSHQIGLLDLRHRIGVFASEPGVYNNHRTQFNAADLAWFAAGLSTEVLHLAKNALPPEFSTVRHGVPPGQVGSLA